jgi:hypothetical protein
VRYFEGLRSGPFTISLYSRAGTPDCSSMSWRVWPVIVSALTIARVGVSHSSSSVGSEVGVRIS